MDLEAKEAIRKAIAVNRLNSEWFTPDGIAKTAMYALQEADYVVVRRKDAMILRDLAELLGPRLGNRHVIHGVDDITAAIPPSSVETATRSYPNKASED